MREPGIESGGDSDNFGCDPVRVHDRTPKRHFRKIVRSLKFLDDRMVAV
jgi:hypothetical protein